MVRVGAAGFLGRACGTTSSSSRRRHRGGAGRPAHARRALVRGRAGQLCAAGAAPCADTRRRGYARHRQPNERLQREDRRDGWGELRRAAPRWRGVAGAGVQPRRPRGGLPAEHARDGDCVPAVRQLGAIWSLCAPDMGAGAVVDRFQQIEPKVLIACDGMVYGGKTMDRREWSRNCCSSCRASRT